MKNKIIKPELLAPAGSFERMKWAFRYGADAVYLGGTSFNLRANATNFSVEEIKEACKYAHKLKKKIYVTVNMIFHDDNIINIKEYLETLASYKVDAVIIADAFLIPIIKSLKHKLDIHLSTQNSTINYEAIQFWANQGISRIVLARETSKQDIEMIKHHTDIELETFIHGAMCSSISGRCVLSNYMTNRDANRGGCSQVCRFDFDLYDTDHKLVEGQDKFTMCSKDLSMYEYLPELINLGIASFKIEGRMRSDYYIASIVSIYRHAIDRYISDPEGYTNNISDSLALSRCANREAVPQFFDHEPGVFEQYYNGRMEVSNQDFLGIVLNYNNHTKMVTISERNFFAPMTKALIFGPKTEPISFVIPEIYDEHNQPVDAARHPKQIITFFLPYKVYKNDIMRVRRDDENE